MADYVSKNGDQFEEIIKAKKDPRFDFLEKHHEFNKYYREKLNELKGKPKEVVKEKKKDSEKQDKRVVSDVKDKEVREIKIVTKKEKKVIGKLSVFFYFKYFFQLLFVFSTSQFLD